MTQYLVRAYRHPSGATIRVTVDNADVAEVALNLRLSSTQ